MEPVDFYKCLADATRLKALSLIQLESELCVCELMSALDESQPKISRHLAHLRKAGLLVDRKQAQWVYYRINPSLPSWLKQIIELSAENIELLTESLSNLQKMGNRPQRQSICCNN